MKPIPRIRLATPDDAADVAAIYAPVVTATTISFEMEPPTVEVMRERIVSTLQRLPWLVSLDSHDRVNGYVYAGKHRERAAYQWAVDTTVYIRDDARGQGLGTALYGQLFRQLVDLGYYQAFAGIALPNAAAWRCMSRWGSSGSGCTGASASSSASGTTQRAYCLGK